MKRKFWIAIYLGAFLAFWIIVTYAPPPDGKEFGKPSPVSSTRP